MVVYVESWDVPYIEEPDYPSELDLVTDAYPDIDTAHLPDDEDLISDMLYALHWDDTLAMFRKIADIFPDPEREACSTLDHAARVLFDNREYLASLEG